MKKAPTSSAKARRMESKFQSMLFNPSDATQPHRGSAFIIESLLLLIFVTASIAVVVQLLGDGYSQGVKAEKLSAAIYIASNEAERFTANPESKSTETIYVNTDNGVQKVSSKKKSKSDDLEFDGKKISTDDPDVFVMKRKITSKSLDAGKIYNASIVVNCQGKEIYSIDTSKYVSDNVTQTDDDDAGDDAYGYGDDLTGGEA